MWIRRLLLGTLLVFAYPAWAESSLGDGTTTGKPAPAASEENVPAPLATPQSISRADAASRSGGARQLRVMASYEFWLSLIVLVFGLVVVLVEYLQLRKIQVNAQEALRVYAVTLIVIGTLFAITAGFDAVQIAPAMGLFGTVAGYLLGKGAQKPVQK